MPELSHDIADDGFHEIQLSGKQLVFLFMAGTVLAVVVFLCGVQVGRGVRNDRPLGADADASGTVATASPASASPPGSAAAAAAGPPAAEPPAPAKESDDELSYAKRLGSDSAPAEKLQPQASAPVAPPPRAPSAKAPASGHPASGAAPAPPKPNPGSAASVPASQNAAGRPGVWVVQLVALKDRSAASSIAQRLSGKGYPAFVVSPAAGAPSIYRVQVGRYNDHREAEQVARRLEKEEQFKPWISH